jgi:predicted DNA-binding transcriptional regulator AlpA
MTATANKQTVWKRKRQVRARYGDCSDRTIDRMVKAGKLPPPQYPLGTKVPFWDEAELDASDKAAAAAYRNQQSAA